MAEVNRAGQNLQCRVPTRVGFCDRMPVQGQEERRPGAQPHPMWEERSWLGGSQGPKLEAMPLGQIWTQNPARQVLPKPLVTVITHCSAARWMLGADRGVSGLGRLGCGSAATSAPLPLKGTVSSH